MCPIVGLLLLVLHTDTTLEVILGQGNLTKKERQKNKAAFFADSHQESSKLPDGDSDGELTKVRASQGHTSTLPFFVDSEHARLFYGYVG